METPIVAIVGRPNVGKSTLFNKIVGKKLSIVDDLPGVTRDGVFSFSNWNGKDFVLVDTGGFETNFKNDDILKKVNLKTKEYLDKATSIIFVVNLKDGISPIDFELANILKKTGKPIFLCVNKCDSIGGPPAEFYEFYSLFQKNVFSISAIHGHNIGDLLDAVVANFKKIENFEDENRIKIAVVGKPNVGKSSLINSLLKENRLIVSDVAGTTRDSIDVTIKFFEKEFVFIDTAGVRKKAKVTERIEKYSVLRSFMAVDRSDIAVIILDATKGATEQDLKIAGFVKERGKGSIIAINKCDLLEKNTNLIDYYSKNLEKQFDFMAYSPHIFISAKTNKRLKNLVDLIEKVNLQLNKRLTTGMLNELLSYSLSKMQPPSRKGKKLKIYYITQVSSKPPTFVFFVNNKDLFHFSYRRYLENQIRKEFEFLGVPLKFIIKENKK